MLLFKYFSDLVNIYTEHHDGIAWMGMFALNLYYYTD